MLWTIVEFRNFAVSFTCAAPLNVAETCTGSVKTRHGLKRWNDALAGGSILSTLLLVPEFHFR